MPEEAPVTASVIGIVPPGESKQLDLAQFAYDEHKCAHPPADPEVLAQLYDRNVPHKACVDAKTANCVGLGWKWVPKKGVESQRAEDYGDFLDKWLEKCARRDQKSFLDILTSARKDEEAVGWAAIEISRNGRGKVDGFYHIHAYTLRRRKDKDGWVQKNNGMYAYFRNYGLKAAKTKNPDKFAGTNEIIIVGEDSPSSAFYPVPDHFPALGDIYGDEAAQAYQLQFFKNNAVPRIAIIVEGGKLDQDTKDFILAYMREGIRGENHQTLIIETAVGSETKVKIEKMTIGEREDASFLEYRRFARDLVLMAHRVSPGKVTLVENANLANSRDQDKTFKEQVIKPDQKRYEGVVQWLIEDTFGDDVCVKFQFEEMDLEDQLQIAQTQAYYMPAMTNNEVRKLYNMPKAGVKPDGTVFDQAAAEWGEAPYEVGMAPMAWGGTGASAGPGGMPEPGGAALDVTKRHMPWISQVAKELGIIIDRIEEIEGQQAEFQPVEKSAPEPVMVQPQVILEAGAIQLEAPHSNGGPRTTIVNKDFKMGPGGTIVGVTETRTEE